jgi:hypothetical protein
MRLIGTNGRGLLAQPSTAVPETGASLAPEQFYCPECALETESGTVFGSELEQLHERS